MEFEFSRLADVNELSEVSSSTKVLVVDNDDIWKADNIKIGTSTYINYLSQYIEWSSSLQEANTPIDFIKTLTVDTDDKPINGFIIITNHGDTSESYIFTINGTYSYPKQTIKKYYQEIENNNIIYYVKYLEFSNGNKILDKTSCYNQSNLKEILVGNLTADSLNSNGDTSVGGSISINGNSSINGNLSVNHISTLTGPTTIGDDLRILGNEEVENNLHVYGLTRINGGLTVDNATNIRGDVSIGPSKKISIHGPSNIVNEFGINNITLSDSTNHKLMIKQDSGGNLSIKDVANNIKIVGVKDPTNDNEAANKHYVDNVILNNNSSLNNRLNNLFSSLGSGSATPYSIITQYIQVNIPNVQNPPVTVNRSFSIDTSFVSPNYDKIKILGVLHNLYGQNGDTPDIYETYSHFIPATYYYEYVNNNNIIVDVEISNVSPNAQNGNIVGVIALIYAIPTSYPDSAEIADLRVPFDYTGYNQGTIGDYVENHIYHEGDYVFYPDSTDGSLYYCSVANSSSSWVYPGEWILATARKSIEDSIYNRLKKDGTDVWSDGNLDMNSNSSYQHRIINLGDPTDPLDATTKDYVDSHRVFVLDNNGILS